MTLLVPNTGTSRILRHFTEEQANTLSLRLFGNNHIPTVNDVENDYVEISGGTYISAVLFQLNWIPTIANPSISEYNNFVEFVFTGVTSPTTVYGYYIRDDSGTTLGNLVLAERFPELDIPIIPTMGAIIKVKPRITSVYVAIP